MGKEVKKENNVRGGGGKGITEEKVRKALCFNVMPEK
jgi:hypothetical protein